MDSAKAARSSVRSTGTALTEVSLRARPDADEPRPPRSARRLDGHVVALGVAEESPADGRLGRDATDAGDDDGHILAVLAGELHVRAHRDHAAGRDRRLVHLDGVVQ